MKTYLEHYNTARQDYWQHPKRYFPTGLAARQLAHAKRKAHILEQWEQAESLELVRLRIEPDEMVDLDDLLGDMYNPDVNPDIEPEKLEQEKKWELDRIDRDGVWGVIGEYKCPICGHWVQVDSCWGFVGDDWKESGYDIDIMAETLEQAKTVCC